jgi:hypothetical protein
MALESIHSGAQTGADQAGLDAALALNLSVGGWIPYGRRIDGGQLSIAKFRLYRLKMHPSPNYPPRTEQNVRECDGTVLFGDMNSPGTAQTIKLCKAHEKPYLELNWGILRRDLSPADVMLREFVAKYRIKVMNVAGNRESTNPGIYQATYDALLAAFGCSRCFRSGRDTHENPDSPTGYTERACPACNGAGRV